MTLPLGHVAGIPLEETVMACGPMLVMAVGAVVARLRAGRLPRIRAADRHHVTSRDMGHA